MPFSHFKIIFSCVWEFAPSYIVLRKEFLECSEIVITLSIILTFSSHTGATLVVSMPAVTPILIGAIFSHSFGMVTCIEISNCPPLPPYSAVALILSSIHFLSSLFEVSHPVSPQLTGITYTSNKSSLERKARRTNLPCSP